jgi:tRNA pseudouridine55 synthase
VIPEGVLLLDKPAGPTSHDLVARARRLLGRERIGHAGTLDPPASGLLVLLLGRTTRLLRFLDQEPKRYTGSFRLGRTTSTDDAAGQVLREHAGPLPSADAVRAAAAGLLGTTLQVPPTVSARKVDGHRMYRLARRGIVVEAPPARVTVSALSVTSDGEPEAWRFEAEVSGGTYVRALVRDLGQALGCGASVTALRREAAGAFQVTAAARVTEDDAEDRRTWREQILPLAALPLALPGVTVDDPLLLRRFRAGTPVPWSQDAGGEVAVRDPAGLLLGIGLVRERTLRPRVILAEPPALW